MIYAIALLFIRFRRLRVPSFSLDNGGRLHFATGLRLLIHTLDGVSWIDAPWLPLSYHLLR